MELLLSELLYLRGSAPGRRVCRASGLRRSDAVLLHRKSRTGGKSGTGAVSDRDKSDDASGLPLRSAAFPAERRLGGAAFRADDGKGRGAHRDSSASDDPDPSENGQLLRRSPPDSRPLGNAGSQDMDPAREGGLFLCGPDPSRRDPSRQSTGREDCQHNR